MIESHPPQEPQEQQDDNKSSRGATIMGAVVIVQLAVFYSPHPQAVGQFAYVHQEDLPENSQRRDRDRGKVEFVMGEITSLASGSLSTADWLSGFSVVTTHSKH